MFKTLILKYPCLWDSFDSEFLNKSYKKHCRELLLEEINARATPPFSVALLKTRINAFLRQKQRERKQSKTNDNSSSSFPTGSASSNTIPPLTVNETPKRMTPAALVDKDDSIYERDVSPIKTEADSGDDDDDEDDSIYIIYEHHVSPIETEAKAQSALKPALLAPANDHGGEATVPEGSSRRHEGCRCDVCRADIVGFRYACVQCDNFDLCGACEARGEHATHYVLRIPSDKLHSDVQAVIERIRDQLLEEQAITVEVKEKVLERDSLEETTSPGGDNVQEISCQDTKSEESEDPLDVNLLDRSEREKTPVFKVSPSYPPYVTQDQSFQPQQNLRNASHQPQAPTHQPIVPKVRSHQSNILIRQPTILIRYVTSTMPEVPSEVLSHQPQVPPSATCQEKKRPLMLEELTSTSEELKPARKKRKGLIV